MVVYCSPRFNHTTKFEASAIFQILQVSRFFHSCFLHRKAWKQAVNGHVSWCYCYRRKRWGVCLSARRTISWLWCMPRLTPSQLHLWGSATVLHHGLASLLSYLQPVTTNLKSVRRFVVYEFTKSSAFFGELKSDMHWCLVWFCVIFMVVALGDKEWKDKRMCWCARFHTLVAWTILSEKKTNCTPTMN